MVIVKRDGVFVVDYYWEGKRRRPEFKTRQDAELFKKRIEEKIESLKKIDGKTKRLKDAIRLYEQIRTVKKSYKTRGNELAYFTKLYAFMKDEFGIQWVHDIRLEHLELLQTELSKEVKPATVNRHFNCYKNFFRQCEMWECVVKNYAAFVKALPVEKNPRKTWTDDEIKLVLNKLPEWAAEIFFTIASTGVRPGEACNLRFKDIDFEKNTITVHSRKGTGAVRSRTLPMPKGVAFIMGKKRFLAKAKEPENFIFSNPSGDPALTNYFSRIVRETTDELGLSGLVAYGLRHTYITKLHDMSVEINDVSILAGHSDIRTTQNYIHGSSARLMSVVEKLETNFTGHQPVTKENNNDS